LSAAAIIKEAAECGVQISLNEPQSGAEGHSQAISGFARQAMPAADGCPGGSLAAGDVLDRLGKHVPELGWMPGDLFNVLRDGRRGGLVWFLRGEGVNQIGADYAQTTNGRVFKRGSPNL
jgi:hypothetical protein